MGAKLGVLSRGHCALCLMFAAGAMGCKKAPEMDAGMRATDAAAHPLDAARSSDAGACDDPQVFPAFTWSCSRLGQGSIQRYDGWALVEQSWDSQLVLAILPSDTDADAGALEIVASAHCHLSSHNRELPSFALGSRVWLHLIQEAVPLLAPAKYGQELSVRDRASGTLILASMEAASAYDRLDADTLTFRAPVARCSKPMTCAKDGMEIQYSVEVAADAPRRITPGERATISLSDMPYEVLLHRARRRTGTKVIACADYVLDDRLWISASLRALAPQAVIGQLSLAELPKCVPGNAPGKTLLPSIYNIPVYDDLATEVTFRERREGTLIFDLPEPPGQFAIPDDALLPKPQPGKTFWLDSNQFLFALRDTRTGPLVLAGGSISTSGDRAVSDRERLSRWLGISVRVELQCVYEMNADRGSEASNYLYQAVFENTKILGGNTQALSLQGVQYDVWFSGFGWFVISKAQ